MTIQQRAVSVTTDQKSGRIMYSVMYLIIEIMESMSLNVAVLPNGNCAACCQQETNAIHLFTYLFTPWSTVLLEKLTGSQLVKKFPHFMEPKISILHSQVPVNCHYHEPARSSPWPHIPLPEVPSLYYPPIYA